MKASLFLLVLPAAVAAGDLSTDYSRDRALRIESTTEIKIATSAFEVLRDGQPVDVPFGGEGPSSEEIRKCVQIDRVVERKDGAPQVVRRTFEKLEGKVSMEMGEYSRDVDEECPLSGVTLELTRHGDEVLAKVIEGDDPGDAKLLEGQDLVLALDALLPAEDVKTGGSWKLGDAEVHRALGLEADAALFRAPKDDEEAAGGGEGRRGGMRRAGALGPLLRKGEWSGTAKLGADEDRNGKTCAIIEVEIKGQGDMPEPQMRERARDRAAGIASLTATLGANTFEVTLEGRLYFSRELGRPVAFEIEGKVDIETTMERSRGEQSFVVHIQRDGTYTQSIVVREEEKP